MPSPSPSADPLRGPARHPATAEQAQAVIAALEASTAHMLASDNRELHQVIAWNQWRVSELRELWADHLDQHGGQQDQP